ncbi:hypothetical protein TNCV_806451 [Trichonephila clavipes]|nr:hypothetical protein TNCV_806451 [Trichonephila clavipes]
MGSPKILTPIPTDSARDEMDTGQMDLLFSHASETTVCLERRAPIMRRKRFRALRGPQTRDERNEKVPFRFPNS